MKWILIQVVMSLTNPTQPAVLMHVPFATQQECQAFVSGMPSSLTDSKEIKIASFCIEKEELQSN